MTNLQFCAIMTSLQIVLINTAQSDTVRGISIIGAWIFLVLSVLFLIKD